MESSVAFAVEYLAWAGLRRRGGLLGFGPAGGVIGVTPTTLFVSQISYFTGRQTKLLGSWPREQVSMTSAVDPKGALRRFQLKFPGTEDPSRLELLPSRGKDDALFAMFGGERDVAFSIAARLNLWPQTWSRSTPGRKVPRSLWWVATLIMMVISQLALSPWPSVMSSTDYLLRVAAAVGSVAVVYAIHRRVDGN